MKRKLKLYNTFTRKKEEFVPLNNKHVTFYSCGPTVYWHPHVGNMRAYVIWDILKRTLIYLGYDIKHTMNYTDVGHLTSDGDTGEDKIEQAAKKEGKTAQEISQFYIDVFDRESESLNILKPDVGCKATDYIQEQIDIIKALEKKGYTYITDDGVYFDTSRFKGYGKLGNINIEGLEEGKRVDIGQKRNKTDFALWKFSVEPGIRQQEWDSPWGLGFPGWHTECVAMATQHLGKQIDIHSGGEDHIQVHHTNEIAQAEAAYEISPWVRYWLHNSYLLYDGEKVSKSKGGLYTVEELSKKGFEPLSVRYFFLMAHYRKQQSFSLKALEGAQQSLDKLRNIILDLRKGQAAGTGPDTKRYKEQFIAAIADDLNMPKALALVWEVARDKDIGDNEKLELLYDFDHVIGLDLKSYRPKKERLTKDVMDIIRKRELARERKDWKESDRLRDMLKAKGIILKDTKQGTEWTSADQP